MTPKPTSASIEASMEAPVLCLSVWSRNRESRSWKVAHPLAPRSSIAFGLTPDTSLMWGCWLATKRRYVRPARHGRGGNGTTNLSGSSSAASASSRSTATWPGAWDGAGDKDEEDDEHEDGDGGGDASVTSMLMWPSSSGSVSNIMDLACRTLCLNKVD